MENRRLFISLAVDPAISKDIYKKFKNFHLPWSKMKTVEMENLHINLKFLGDTPLNKIPEIIDTLNSIKKQGSDLELTLDKTLIFNQRRPQTLVLHLTENKKLQKLYDDIEQALFDAGLSHKEIRKFTAHLTLARVKKPAEFEEFEEFTNWQIKKNLFVNYFELIESELTSKGPQYTVLQTFDL
ncbi:RNA 2',3'-cyclic phosphodiesterase [bacterium]|nr:RNA 2',3'-cyclic phosphodiesterase [bacterium]